MEISFSQKHAFALILALIIFSLVAYIVVRSIITEDDRTVLSSNIQQIDRVPVQHYQQTVTQILNEWKQEWDKLDENSAKLESITNLQDQFQEIVIKKEDQESHINYVLMISKLKRAQQSQDDSLVLSIIEDIMDY